jgi:hypothetical protein
MADDGTASSHERQARCLLLAGEWCVGLHVFAAKKKREGMRGPTTVGACETPAGERCGHAAWTARGERASADACAQAACGQRRRGLGRRDRGDPDVEAGRTPRAFESAGARRGTTQLV